MSASKTTSELGLSTEVLDNLLEGFQLISYDWRYLYVNSAVAEQGKSTKEDLLGATMMERYPGIEKTDLFKVLEKCMAARVSETMENEFTFPDGSKGWFELRIEPVSGGLFILSMDISERKRAELELLNLQKSLEEKVKQRTKALEKANQDVQTLLKEMHHRVKNNLQIVSSLLNLQANAESDQHLVSVLQHSRERIHTISKLHESLYSKENIFEINIKDYLKEIIESRIEMQEGSGLHITFEFDCPDVNLDVAKAVPVGLLINELVTNSVKHAFVGRTKGRISCKISRENEGELTIEYGDNGIGMPKGHETAHNGKKIGELLIESFIEQLNATSKLASSNQGVQYSIVMPLLTE